MGVVSCSLANKEDTVKTPILEIEAGERGHGSLGHLNLNSQEARREPPRIGPTYAFRSDSVIVHTA